MNKKVLFSSTLAFASALFVGCGEAPLNETYAEDAGDLLVYARDAGSGGVLPAARVTLFSVDKAPRAVDATGNVTYSSLPVGTGYTLRVEAEGYATMLCRANISAQVADNVLNAQNTVLQASLSKLGASVRGTVVYNDPKAVDRVNVLPAAGAQLEIRLGDAGACSFEKKDFAATVAADGSYEFKNLPEAAPFVLYGHPATLSGISYVGFNTAGSTGLVGTVETLPPQTGYGQVASSVEFRIVSGPSRDYYNRTEIATDGSIEFVFSKPVNINKAGLAGVVVRNSDEDPVAVVASWSPDSTKLTIKPHEGAWTLNDYLSVNIPVRQIRSNGADEELSDGYSLNGIYYLKVPLGIDLRAKKASTPVLNGVTPDGLLGLGNIPIRWGRTEGAKEYKVYTKRTTTSYYAFEYTIQDASCVATSYCGTSINNYFDRYSAVDAISIIIVANDDKNVSQASDPLTLARPRP